MKREDIAGKIEVVLSSVEQLRKLAGQTQEDFDSDLRNLDSAEHRLQLSIEALMDIGAHAIGALGLDTPKKHSDIPAILARANEFPQPEVETMQKMSAFCNRIVHLYNRVDVNVIWDILQNHIEDIPRILNCLLDIVDRHPDA